MVVPMAVVHVPVYIETQAVSPTGVVPPWGENDPWHSMARSGAY
eukprot:SAG22_NODE_21170_length_259_cov_0.650000_1_plen_43_part_01